jgi:quercetin dioxygenase-like cupin family protein
MNSALVHVSMPGNGIAGSTSDGLPLSVRAPFEATGGALRLIEIEEQPRSVALVHFHDYDEAWYVLDGTYGLLADDEWFVLRAGAFVFVPAGISHGFAVLGAANARKLAVALGQKDQGTDTKASSVTAPTNWSDGLDQVTVVGRVTVPDDLLLSTDGQ